MALLSRKLSCFIWIVDIDECVDQSDDCDKETSKCRDTLGGFECDCNKGLALIPGKTNFCEGEQLFQRYWSLIWAFQIWTSARSALTTVNLFLNSATTPSAATRVTAAMGISIIFSQNRNFLFSNIETGRYVEKGKDCVPFSNCPKDFPCGTNAFCVMRPSRETKGQEQPECVCQDGYYVSNMNLVQSSFLKYV